MRKKKNSRQHRGFILPIVVMSILVIFVVVLGVLSRNTSRAASSLSSARRLQAELVGKSALWRMNEVLRTGGAPLNYSEVVAGVTYTVTYTLTGVGTGPNNTNIYTITVTY